MVNEKRKQPRILVSQLITLSFDRENYINGKCLNISESGLYFEIAQKIEPQTKLFIMLVMEGNKKDKVIKFEGIAVRLEEKKGKHFIAVQIVDISNDNRKKINKFIKESS